MKSKEEVDELRSKWKDAQQIADEKTEEHRKALETLSETDFGKEIIKMRFDQMNEAQIAAGEAYQAFMTAFDETWAIHAPRARVMTVSAGAIGIEERFYPVLAFAFQMMDGDWTTVNVPFMPKELDALQKLVNKSVEEAKRYAIVQHGHAVADKKEELRLAELAAKEQADKELKEPTDS